MQSRPQPWPIAEDRPPRPLLLFEPPQPVAVIAGVPDGPPQRFRWRDRLHEVRLAEGPERIAAEWWRKRDGHQPGGAGKTRDYYRIEDGDGRRYWMFRHGLFGEETEICWYLHGLFP
jgi:protein ImuB